MMSNRGPSDLASEWKEAFNSHDLDRILALYSEDVVFKSPRVRTIAAEESGVLRGQSAVRDYWQRLFERRPNLECTSVTSSPASIVSPWNIAFPADFTALNS
jgi:hypothetical protein